VSCALSPASLFLAFLFRSGRASRLSLPRLRGQLPDAQLPQAAIGPQPHRFSCNLLSDSRVGSFRRREDEHFPRGFTHFRLEMEKKG
jgi:hypothetical protein